MHILFDRPEHKEKFISIIKKYAADIVCPSSIGMDDSFKIKGEFTSLCNNPNNCLVCWENAIDKVSEVNDDHNI